jgi:hypothetical protein
VYRPWEPSVVLGNQLVVAVALGCPALTTLEARTLKPYIMTPTDDGVDCNLVVAVKLLSKVFTS